MNIVAIKWERGWFGSYMEYKIWAQILKTYGIEKILACPISGISANSGIELEEYKDMNHILNKYNTHKRVFLEPPFFIGKYSNLLDYQHKKDNNIYIIGNAQSGNRNLISEKDDVVGIETPHDSDLWGFSAMSIFLQDKYNKEK